jgi:hypothetical protein
VGIPVFFEVRELAFEAGMVPGLVADPEGFLRRLYNDIRGGVESVFVVW